MITQGGLTLPDSVGLSEKIAQELHNVWDTFDAVEVVLTKQGFMPLEKPGHTRPTLSPGTLERTNSTQFTEIYEKFTAWYSYAANLLARIKGGISQIDNEMDILAVKLKYATIEVSRKAGQKRPAKEILEDQVKMDPHYQELMLEKQKLDQQRLIMDSHVESLYRDWRVISRQVEIRRQEIEQNQGRPYVGVNPPSGMTPPGRF